MEMTVQSDAQLVRELREARRQERLRARFDPALATLRPRDYLLRGLLLVSLFTIPAVLMQAVFNALAH